MSPVFFIILFVLAIYLCYYNFSNKFSIVIMDTRKGSFPDKLKNEFFKTHFTGNTNTTGLSLWILLILIYLLLLVGILS